MKICKCIQTSLSYVRNALYITGLACSLAADADEY